MVLYTDAEMTATHSNTVAANRKRSFWRKLIAEPPEDAHRSIASRSIANQSIVNQPAKHQPGKVPTRSNPPVVPFPDRARAHSPHSRWANEKAGSPRNHRASRARLDRDRPSPNPDSKTCRASPPGMPAAAIATAARL